MKQNINNKIVKRDTSQILNDTIQNIAAGLTGLASSDRKELLLSVGHIIQRLRGGNILSAFLKEWEEFKEKGAIKDDYPHTEQHLNCLHELLDFLENDIPDDIRIKALKKILLVAASEKFSSRDDILPHQYMKICKGLSGGEMIVLFTAYDIAKKANFNIPKSLGASRWLEEIAENSALKTSALVELHEEELMKKKLISERANTDRSGISLANQSRLTNFAIDFCKYIDNYDDLKENL